MTRFIHDKNVQKQAIEEIEALPVSHPFRTNALKMLSSPLLALPPEDLAPLLLQLSREELLSRFGAQN